MPGTDPFEVENLAFDPTSNTLYGSKTNSGTLYTINQATAALTLVGQPSHVNTALDFAANGTLYGSTFVTDALYTVNTSTAVDTLVGGGGSALLQDAAMTKAGELFVTGFDGVILQVDPATGNKTLVGTGLGEGLLGVIPTPEPTSLVLTVLALVPITACGYRMRRIRRNSIAGG